MRLYLVQHGQARPKEEDPDRSLTPRGQQDAEKMAAFLKPLGLRVHAIWQSGKKRAHQTAELLKAGLVSERGVLLHDNLSPNDPVGPVKKELKGLKDDLMIVGHLPFLSQLASELICGRPNEDIIAFRQAGVVALEQLDGNWQVAWVVTPEVIP